MVAVALSPPASPVEVEMCAPFDRQISFRPIRRVLRGRVDFSRGTTKTAVAMRDAWPEPIPGQIVGISETGEKYIREPLYDKEHVKVAQRIKNKGMMLPDERESFASESIVTWLYWLRRIVDAGHGRVVKGTLPPIEELEPTPRRKPRDESKARKSFILDEPEESAIEKLADAMDRLATNVAQNTVIMQRLLEKLAK